MGSLDSHQAGAAGRLVYLDARQTLALLLEDGHPDERRFRTVIGGVLRAVRASTGRRRPPGGVVEPHPLGARVQPVRRLSDRSLRSPHRRGGAASDRMHPRPCPRGRRHPPLGRPPAHLALPSSPVTSLTPPADTVTRGVPPMYFVGSPASTIISSGHGPPDRHLRVLPGGSDRARGRGDMATPPPPARGRRGDGPRPRRGRVVRVRRRPGCVLA